MTITASVTQLRDNMAWYMDSVSKGTSVLVKDEKRGVELARITSTKRHNKVAYENTLRKVAGVFSDERHREWKTKEDVIDWVNKSRRDSERSFN